MLVCVCARVMLSMRIKILNKLCVSIKILQCALFSQFCEYPIITLQNDWASYMHEVALEF